MKSVYIEKIINCFNDFEIDLDEEKAKKLYSFYEILMEKNKVMNLTGITDFDDALIKHFIDSAFVLKKCKDIKNNKIIDIGTGAGFPGIPLKIIVPEINITLIDSLNKRINFLNEVIENLSLKDITAIHGRAEELSRNKDLRESFDLALSRAVSNASTLSEYAIPFLKTGGYFIAYKGGDSDDEILSAKGAIRKLGGRIEEIYKYNINEFERSFMIIKKEAPTPDIYPRKAGTPSKKPLK